MGKSFVSLKVKELWFDSDKVLRSVDRATRSVLGRFGSYVRREAKKLIKPAGKRAYTKAGKAGTRRGILHAAPGKPPKSHTGLLRKGIFYSYDRESRSVVIGPVPLAGRGQAEVPLLLEEGGTAVREHWRRGRKEKYMARYAPHPYMGPALKAKLPQLEQLWANSVKS